MDLNIYDVIIRPVMTSKARRVSGSENQLVLEVHMHANKPMVARALKLLFNVDAVSLRSAVDKGKRRMVGRRVVVSGRTKRMYVTLKAGQVVASQLGDVAQAGPGALAAHDSV